MGLLKELDRRLDVLLQRANEHVPDAWSSLHMEFLCCCERARHAIKDFTNQGDDGKASDSFLLARDALCDLKWCLDEIPPLGRSARHARWEMRASPSFLEIRRLFFPLMCALTLNNTPGPSHSSDAGNWLGSADLPPGLNVDDFGEIEHLHVLGEGAQGKVYEAMWRGVDPVAVKEVSSDTRSEALESSVVFSSGVSGVGSNLDSELQVLKTLNHPNIVELKGYTRKVRAGKYGLVMELMKCSLQHLILKGEAISELACVDTLLQVARGMRFLHRVGIMHRDLKPANILIGEFKYLPATARRLGYVVAKLADFGLSKQDLTEDGAGWHTYKQGTSFYMAPELRKSCNNAGESRYARSADVFSFGTTCFAVLTGEESPCNPLGPGEFYEKIEKGDLDELLEKCRPSCKISGLVRECWCPDPNRRPTFLEICQILEEEKRRMLASMELRSPDENLSPGPGRGGETAVMFDQTEAFFQVKGMFRQPFPPWEVKANKFFRMWASALRQTTKNTIFRLKIEQFHELGRGGKGSISEAMWNGVCPVAVKRVSLGTLQNALTDWHRAGFYHDQWQVLHHPNVVELKGHLGLSQSMQGAVVMELMKFSLRDLINAMPFPELACVDTLLQVARGMQFLHGVGIIHGHLKPANILIGEFTCLPHQNAWRVVAKVADFGLLETDNRLPSFYTAPESPNEWSKSADVFSFGTICFNVLSGEGNRVQAGEFLDRILRGDLGELLDKCRSSTMASLVRQCWGPEPAKRPTFPQICDILEEEKARLLASYPSTASLPG